MTADHVIPDSITHLDFDPDEEEKKEHTCQMTLRHPYNSDVVIVCGVTPVVAFVVWNKLACGCQPRGHICATCRSYVLDPKTERQCKPHKTPFWSLADIFSITPVTS